MKPIRKSTLAALVVVLVLIPVTLYMGTRLEGQRFYLISTCIVVEAMLPFFFLFEGRKPQAREIVTIAVMAALATVSRSVFAFVPHFKPTTAIIMLTGIALGPEAGFLTGAMCAFASNFAFGQGPWTPWQMLAFGICGFLPGLLFYKRKLADSRILSAVLLAVYGFASILFLIGPLLDLCSVFTFGSVITPAYVKSVLLSGVPVNLTHGAACAITMLLVSDPLLSKLERLKTKYGILEARDRGV